MDDSGSADAAHWNRIYADKEVAGSRCMAPVLRCPEPRPPGTRDSRAGAGESAELQDTLPAQLTQTLPGRLLWCIVPLKTAFMESRIAGMRGRTQPVLAHAMEVVIEVADGILRAPAG